MLSVDIVRAADIVSYTLSPFHWGTWETKAHHAPIEWNHGGL